MKRGKKVYNMDMILASASPRRQELLTRLGLPFRVVVPNVDESALTAEDPAVLVTDLAEAKARAVAAEDRSLVLAADTVVVLNGQVLGKPKDEAEAAAMLRALGGRSHLVYTGLCLIRGKQCRRGYEKTVVRMRSLSEADIAAYVLSGEPMDKAGSYGIQGLGALFVSGIEGDFYTVMGLPLCRLGEELRAFGIHIPGKHS